jgi:hypothetical protein
VAATCKGLPQSDQLCILPLWKFFYQYLSVLSLLAREFLRNKLRPDEKKVALAGAFLRTHQDGSDLSKTGAVVSCCGRKLLWEKTAPNGA